MLSRSSWLEGKIPFQLLLLPLFWITLLLSPNLNQWKALWVLGITHGLLYSSASAYVNFYDASKRYFENWTIHRRTPHVRLYLAIVLHALAVVLGAIYVNSTFAVLVLLYGIAAHAFGISRAQLRSPSYAAWGFIRSVQGVGAALIYYSGLNNFSIGQTAPKILVAGFVASLLLAAFYPADGSLQPVKKAGLVWGNVAILLIAGVLSIWLFRTVVSSQYTAGIIAAFSFGIVFILEKYIEDPQNSTQRIALRHWLGTLALNAYAFYLFTDYSQVFQLIY